MNILNNKNTQKIAKKVILRRNYSNVSRHFPDLAEKYSVPQNPKAKEEYLTGYCEDTEDEDYKVDAKEISPHILMKAFN